MTEQIATPVTPQAPGAPKPAETPTPEAPKAPPWGSDENFNPAKAWELIENLRKEKTPDTSGLETRLAEMQATTEARNKALAEALGLTEAPKSEDALAETVKALQEKFEQADRLSTKLRIAAEKNIPAEYHDLLTETDPEKLSAQAEKVGALVAANAAAAATPGFQPNPGQGQGGGGASPEAITEAEYRQYHPLPSRK